MTPGNEKNGLKVSIITIVYNNAGFVEDTIRSVVGQSYSSIEYIIVDGGSTDGTLDVIRKYDQYIAKWISEKDDGIADAFNKGLALATGDYIVCLNSDDMLSDNSRVQVMVDEIIKNDYPCFIYGDFDIVDRDSGNILYRGVVNFTPKGMIKKGEIFPHPCLFTHKDYFKNYGIFDTRFKIAMDYELFMRGIFQVKIVHVPELITTIRGGGVSTFNRPVVIDEIILALEKNGYLRSGFARARKRLYYKSRLVAKKSLEFLCLYKLFFSLRNVLRRAGL